MNVDMEVAGQKMRMVTDGEKGWVSIPGQGTMPMPDEMMAQLREQTNVSQNYRWNKKDYSYKLAGEVQEGGRTYTGVLMTPKNRSRRSATWWSISTKKTAWYLSSRWISSREDKPSPHG